MPISISGIKYGSYSAESFNLSCVLLILPFLSSLVLYIVSKASKNNLERQEKTKKWAWLAICEWGFTAVCFFFYHTVTSLCVFAIHSKTNNNALLASSLIETCIVISCTVASTVLYRTKELYFGDYKAGLRIDLVSRVHYWLLLGVRLLTCIALVLGRQFK